MMKFGLGWQGGWNFVGFSNFLIISLSEDAGLTFKKDIGLLKKTLLQKNMSIF